MDVLRREPTTSSAEALPNVALVSRGAERSRAVAVLLQKFAARDRAAPPDTSFPRWSAGNGAAHSDQSGQAPERHGKLGGQFVPREAESAK